MTGEQIILSSSVPTFFIIVGLAFILPKKGEKSDVRKGI
ncbi:hypothetical protein Deia_00890 [Candidatus Deianiraea vastatrix]|uniref:Uncharacterized protein n=1 Tax=Candidatus Deianiraea vastatrix TaxID=2163644 RepID=A0A5B8XJA7_9RICK|nr:hypothetical protein Deia_00890 [Candidatus Deianiraea vastatrix]